VSQPLRHFRGFQQALFRNWLVFEATSRAASAAMHGRGEPAAFSQQQLDKELFIPFRMV